jgi:hypothetical protein
MGNNESERASADEDGGMSELRTRERDEISKRRATAYADPATDSKLWPVTGLALSGGGIRSATFCLGLLRGLAQNELLKRFDYVSTVSGGGFTGGMLGRLISRLGIARAEEALREGGNLLLWWLRSNGRYLTPSGARDLGVALVTYLRAWVAVQLEFAVISVLLAFFIVLPHLTQETLHWLDWQTWPPGFTPWWPFAALWTALTVPAPMAAYWIVRDPPMQPPQAAAAATPPPAPVRPRVPKAPSWLWILLNWLVCGIGLVGAVAVLWAPTTQGIALRLPDGPVLAGLALFTTVASVALTYLELPPRRSGTRALCVAILRNRLTQRLRLNLVVAFLLGAIGALDIGSWQALRWLVGQFSAEQQWFLGGIAGAGGAVLLLLRAFAEPLQKAGTAADSRSLKNIGPRLLNLLGVLACLFLFFIWLVIAQDFIFHNPSAKLARLGSLALALLLVGAALAWTFGTGSLNDAANASSLHSFYRARLTRAYLSIGNAKRGPDPDEAATYTSVRTVSPVTEVVEGDDLALLSYRPQARGGPIHLINTCFNQTHDDRSGLYNADRKGMLLTVSANGVEIGPRHAEAFPPGYDPGTLGRWTAISGAAVATGAGAYTSRGWAALMFMLGVRLGYWVKGPIAGPEAPWSWGPLVKQSMLTSEATAKFLGLERPWWYLSDGGHFENTGVYALLRRELDFILVADCGADPQYEFNDLENLVRKARIDFDADIEFYTQDAAQAFLKGPGAGLSVVSPENLVANSSSRAVLLARITYRRSDPNYRKAGTLLVVKPAVHDALDADVLGYASRSPDFPQQSTGNQFFDEAQWESYHRLGEDYGRALTANWLAQLPGWAAPVSRTTGEVAPLRPVKPPTSETLSPAWKRTAQAAAVGTTLGLGALGTAALAGWQVLDQFNKTEEAQRVKAEGIVKDTAADLESLNRTPPVVPTAALPHADLLFKLKRQTPPHAALASSIEILVDGIHARCGELSSAEASASKDVRSFCERLAELESKGHAGGADPLPYWTHPVATEGVSSASKPASGESAANNGIAAATSQVLATEASTATGATTAPSQPALGTGQSPGTAPNPLRECLGKRLYTQVYDEPSRSLAAAFLRGLQWPAPGIHAIENVNATADSTGTRRPIPWRVTTLIVHDGSGVECAGALERVIKEGSVIPTPMQIKPLPVSLTPTPGVIELWIPQAATSGR